MSTTTTFPQVTIRSSSPKVVTGALPVGCTDILLLVNRNVGSNPVDGFLETDTVMTLVIESSLDGGATWQEEGRADVNGGVILTRQGTELTASSIQISGINGDPASSNRQGRMTVSTTQARVSVSGSATFLP